MCLSPGSCHNKAALEVTLVSLVVTQQVNPDAEAVLTSGLRSVTRGVSAEINMCGLFVYWVFVFLTELEESVLSSASASKETNARII